MNATDAKIAIDNLLTACNAMLPQAENFDRFVSDRSGAVAELSSVRAELIKAQSAVAQARFELDDAKTRLQAVKDEMAWMLKDLARVRQEFDELERAKRRRG